MARSYEILPMGLPVPAADVAAWGTARVAQAFALGFSLAAPFVIAAFAYNLALGAINRAMPQLMVAFIGAPAITAGGAPDPDAGRAGDPALLGRPARPRRSPTRWRCRDERGRRQRRREGLRPDAAALAEARRKGDIPRSTDVTAAATYLGAARGRRHRRRPARVRSRRLGADGLHRPARPADGPGARPRRRRALGADPRRGAGRRWRRSSSCRSPPCSSASSPSRRSPSPATSSQPKLSRLSLARQRQAASSAPTGLVEFAKAVGQARAPSRPRSSSTSRATSTG